MTDRPIIFSGPMVRALLDGRKTQTRRVLCQFDPDRDPPQAGPYFAGHKAATWTDREGTPWRYPGAKGAATGDRLWVREAWSINAHGGFSIGGVGDWGYSLDFRAGGTKHLRFSGHYADDPYMRLYDTQVGDWRSPIHMPRWASRLTLTVTDVRVQRLQDISAEDVQAEGACELAFVPPTEADTEEARGIFRDLWNSLHGPDAWDSNPWVVALTFTVEKRNIDGALT